METKLEFAIAYLSNVISIRVKDDLLQGISPEKRKKQTFDGLKATFVGESQNKPVVVILEDIHWIDQTSEEFLLYLSSSVAKNRIMILALHRPIYQCPWMRSSSYQQISIRRLSRVESEEMLRNMLRVQVVAVEVKDLVQRKAEGNPFFMEELILELLESGLVRKEGKVCRLVDQAANPPVPATVQDVIMARIDRLEDIYKRTLQLASVIGREFARKILEQISESAERLSESLEILKNPELIQQIRVVPEAEYLFKHVITQEVTYETLLKQKRKELHSLVAQAIEELYADRLEEFYEMMAFHYWRAEVWSCAYRYNREAGLKAQSLSAYILPLPLHNI